MPSLQQDMVRVLVENKQISKAIMDSPLLNTQAKTAFSVVKAELDEIEGERIALLVELDKVKEYYQQIKEKMYSELAKQKKDQIESMQRELDALKEERQAAEETLRDIGESIRSGTLELVAHKTALDVQSSGSDILLSPTLGVQFEQKDIVETVRSKMSDLGFLCKQDCITAFMIIFALHDEFCMTADSLAEAELYVKNLLRALGLLNVSAWPSPFGTLRIVSLLPENDLRTPTIEVIRNERTPIRAYGHKTIRLLDKKNVADAGALPVLRAPVFNRNRAQENLTQNGKPISLRSIHAFADRAALLYKDGEAWPEGFRQKLDAYGIEIAEEARIAARIFVRAATPQMIGGFIEAIDTAALIWIVPRLIGQAFPKAHLSELIGNLPKCMKIMTEADY
ncbi:MAG: hypothetical protein IH607_06710 [Firmicutes bacterium]|nr:hypothetical protein [Bacillota bacterium]